jgi:hypothetical protein
MLAYVSARVPVTTTVCYVSSAALNLGGYLLRELGSCMHRERRDEMRVGGNTVSRSVITLIQYRLFIVGSAIASSGLT